uniref:Major facilitator superfamily (MFS) profile domain-containing protein n=1 Tax=Strigamia maritima TaxID=126957 RepID=T1JMT7_STRMM
MNKLEQRNHAVHLCELLSNNRPLSCGIVTDIQFIYLYRTIMFSIALICIAFSKNYIQIAFGIFFFGMFAGSAFVLIPVILTKNHGVSKLASSFGILRSSMALTCLIAPPIAGYIRDVTGSFKASLWIIVCMFIIAVLKYRNNT